MKDQIKQKKIKYQENIKKFRQKLWQHMPYMKITKNMP